MDALADKVLDKIWGGGKGASAKRMITREEQVLTYLNMGRPEWEKMLTERGADDTRSFASAMEHERKNLGL